jgi:hypothetical protein
VDVRLLRLPIQGTRISLYGSLRNRSVSGLITCSKVIGLIINLIEHTLLRGCGSDNYIEKCQKVPPDKKQYTLTGAHFNIVPLC